MIPLTKLIVYGDPAPQGSKRALPIYRGSRAKGTREFTGRTALVEMSSKVEPWRTAIADAVRVKWPTAVDLAEAGYPIDEACCARIVFTMPAIADRRRRWPFRMPDLDKLLRSTLDGLKVAGLLRDDARIVNFCRAGKVYPNGDAEALDRAGAFIDLHPPHDNPLVLEVIEEARYAAPPGALF